MQKYVITCALLSLTVASGIALNGCSGDDDSTSPAKDAGADGTVVGIHDSGAQPGATDGGVADGSTSPPSTDGGDAGDGGAAQACLAYAQAKCAKADACSNGVRNVAVFGDLATCVTRFATQCLANVEGMGNGETNADLQACTQAVGSESCLQNFGVGIPESCIPSKGTLANGDACFAAVQCSTGYCAIPSGTNCGHCAAVPKAGDSCTTTGECFTNTGLACNNGTCVAYAAAGGSCASTGPLCPPGYTCTTGSAGSTCEAETTVVGGACGTSNTPNCSGGYGLTCVSGACAAIHYADAGAACGASGTGGAPTACAASGTCASNGTGSACIAAAADMAACDTAKGPGCLPYSVCLTGPGTTKGVCTPLNGTTCP